MARASYEILRHTQLIPKSKAPMINIRTKSSGQRGNHVSVSFSSVRTTIFMDPRAKFDIFRSRFAFILAFLFWPYLSLDSRLFVAAPGGPTTVLWCDLSLELSPRSELIHQAQCHYPLSLTNLILAAPSSGTERSL
ncbi:hypothetical protein CRG98_002709 [Punica granatum]|uniref:Uncharacterized protein n=1 Tax=Punica granatum TaxID=22663 RepID=A0A2I0L899_PUNGR|nr:hypothetical protein CRG98_002709 [Punica granatum]